MKKQAVVPFLIAAMFVIAMSTVMFKNYDGSAGTSSGDLAFETTTDGEAALAQAKAEDKLVMIDFYADWCGPCKQMEKQAFTDESVGEMLKDVIVLRVDVDEPGTNSRLIKKHFDGSLPQIVFLDSDGDEIGSTVGYSSVSGFKKDIKRILRKA